jgi:phasin family protein
MSCFTVLWTRAGARSAGSSSSYGDIAASHKKRLDTPLPLAYCALQHCCGAAKDFRDNINHEDHTMQKEILNNISELGQTAFEAARRVGEVNLRAGEKLLEQQLALTSTLLETGARNLELMSQAKTPQEVLNGQAKLVQACGEQWLNSCRGTAEIFAEARDVAGELIEENVKVARENVKRATTSKAA